MNETDLIVKLTPIPLLVIALNIIGLGLKKVPTIPNWTVPLFLPVIGAIVYPFIGAMVPIGGIEKLAHPSVFYALIGFVCGGVAVWGHQVVTQYAGRNGAAPAPTP